MAYPSLRWLVGSSRQPVGSSAEPPWECQALIWRHSLGHQPLHHARHLLGRRPVGQRLLGLDGAADRRLPGRGDRRPGSEPHQRRQQPGLVGRRPQRRGLAAINKTGTTQLRVYFNLDDDNDRIADYIGYYSGESSTSANRPQLVVTYQ